MLVFIQSLDFKDLDFRYEVRFLTVINVRDKIEMKRRRVNAHKTFAFKSDLIFVRYFCHRAVRLKGFDFKVIG